MSLNDDKILARLAKEGVLSRYETRGYESALRRLLRDAFVEKRRRGKKIFYELAEGAIPYLEAYRLELLAKVKKLSQLHPRSRVYKALLEDVRFLNKAKPEAKAFLFLGDWLLNYPVVPSQLLLAKSRFYAKQGLL